MTPPPVPSFTDWDDETFERELERVTRGAHESADDRPVDDLELVAAAVHLAALDHIEQPPASLMERLRAQAREARHEAGPQALAGDEGSALRALPSTLGAPAGGGNRSALGFVAWAGWLVAAGILAVFLLRGADTPDVRVLRENVLAASDAVQLDWTRTEDPYAGSVSGDVVWSTAQQSGFMSFRDLPQNDPSEIQYQLWIFDGSRPDSPPIDGGVFDVVAGEEVIVPIHAKLAVGEPTLFAVTVEKTGGVVVSEKDHIVVVAELQQG